MSARRLLLALAVGAAPLLQMAGMVPHPELGQTAAQTLALVAADPDEWFRIHALAAAAAALSIVASLALASLVRGRGAAFATTGAALSVLGSSGLVFAFAAEAHLWSLAGDPSLDPAAVVPLLALEQGSPAADLLLVSFPFVGLGSLLLMSGLLRSRSVPRWQPALVVVGSLTSIAATPGLAIGPLLFLPGLLGSLALAVSVAQGPVEARELALAA